MEFKRKEHPSPRVKCYWEWKEGPFKAAISVGPGVVPLLGEETFREDFLLIVDVESGGCDYKFFSTKEEAEKSAPKLLIRAAANSISNLETKIWEAFQTYEKIKEHRHLLSDLLAK